MSVGKSILELIDINCNIWHNATRIKTIDNSVKETDLSSEERVKIFFKIRELNADRSCVRSKVDKYFDPESVDETKLFIGDKEEC